MSLIKFLEENKETRKIFGERELKIIEKQLLGIKLTQSEKNRLSRDIRKKFEVIGKLSRFEDEFNLKKGSEIRKLIDDVKKRILDSEWRNQIKEIWLFGSSVTNERTFRSDIDIVVLFKEKISLRKSTKFRIEFSWNKKIDVQVFEHLSKKIQNSILKNHKVLYNDG